MSRCLQNANIMLIVYLSSSGYSVVISRETIESYLLVEEDRSTASLIPIII